MSNATLVVAFLSVVGVVGAIAKRFDMQPASPLVLVGMALAWVPLIDQVSVDPDLAFLMFVPPLLYWAALTTSLRDFRRNLRPILLLAVGLVLATVAAIAVVAHAIVPDLSWPAAFVLGAVVSPPDAAVATTVARRLGIPARLVTVLEGETLVNDSTAFLSYKIAVLVATTGTVSAGAVTLRFVWMVVAGIAGGLIIATLLMLLRPRVRHTEVENTLSLLSPFALYVPVETLGGSGVLAVLVGGLALGRASPRIVSARTRAQGEQVWLMVRFVLEGATFLLIGLELARQTKRLLVHFDAALLAQAAIIAVAVIVARFAWVFPAVYLPRWLSKGVRQRDPLPPVSATVFLSWAGLRGGDTLVTALAVPLVTSSGAAFAARDTISFIAFFVIFVSLLIQAPTLAPLARWLGLQRLAAQSHEIAEEQLARREVLKAGAHAIRHAASAAGLSATATDDLVRDYEHRRQTRNRRPSDDHERDAALLGARIERALIRAERQVLLRLRDDERISDTIMRAVQHELDHDELALDGPG